MDIRRGGRSFETADWALPRLEDTWAARLCPPIHELQRFEPRQDKPKPQQRTKPRYFVAISYGDADLSAQSASQHVVKALGDDSVFTGLQHPHTHDDGVSASRQSGAGGRATRGGIQLNPWISLAHFLHDFGAGDLDFVLVVGNKQVRNVVCNRRNKNLGFDGRQGFQTPGDPIGAPAELRLHGGIILTQEPIHRSHQTYNLLFRHFHSAADGVRVWRIVFSRGFDQVFSTQQQARTLRPAQTFAAGEGHQVESHLGVIPKIGDWGNIRRCIIETRHRVLVSHTYPIFPADLTFTGIKKVGHDGLVRESLPILVESFNFHKANSRISDGMIVSIAMRLLDDDRVFKPIHIGGYADDCRIVAYRHASGRSNHKRRRRARRHQGGLTFQSLCQIFARSIEQFFKVDRLPRSLRYRGLDFVGHGGSRKDGVGSSRVDEGRYPQLLVVVH